MRCLPMVKTMLGEIHDCQPVANDPGDWIAPLRSLLFQTFIWKS